MFHTAGHKVHGLFLVVGLDAADIFPESKPSKKWERGGDEEGEGKGERGRGRGIQWGEQELSLLTR